MEHAHLIALGQALDRERRARDASLARLVTRDPAAQLAAGVAIQPLELVSTELRSKERVNVLLRGFTGGDGLTAGDAVLLSPVRRPGAAIPGRCLGVDAGHVELRVDGVPDGVGPWRVQRRSDGTMFDLELASLRRVVKGSLAHLLLGLERPYAPDPYDDPAFEGLSPVQRQAAARAYGATEIGLVHGPPGSGKTRILVSILRALRSRGEKPWALGPTNPAADALALRASAAGLDVVRLGLSPRVDSAVQHLTLEHRILNGARAPVIHQLLRDAIRATGEALDEIQQAIREEWSTAKREILDGADVLAMTLENLHTRGADLVAPRTVVVDEANAVWEPSIWLLATRVKRIILGGDIGSLGPASVSRDPLLERSLLQRLIEAGFHFPALTERFRPQPARQLIDTAGMGLDEEPDGADGFLNPGELGLIRTALTELADAGFSPSQIGLITPYNGQLVRLRAELPGFRSGLPGSWVGQEADAVIVSFVRSNLDGQPGLGVDPRTLQLLTSRARQRWIGIGDSATLGPSHAFQALLAGIEAEGGYRSGWDLSG